MPRGKPFKPGQSGNPNGRPVKSRALTEILEKAGNKTIKVDGKGISGKRLYAKRLWELINTGKITLDGRVYKVESAKEWTEIILKMLSHIDGPAKGELDFDGVIHFLVEYADGLHDNPTETP